MEEKRKRIDIGLDNPVMEDAKHSMNAVMALAVAKAIETGSMEGTATLAIRFELETGADKDTGETFLFPNIQYKSKYAVPIKDSIGRIIQNGSGYSLISGQISMEEILEEMRKE